MRCDIKLNGLEEYLEKLRRVGADIDKIAEEAVEESAKPVYEDIRKWAEKHKRTGAAYKGVVIPKAENSAGEIYTELGIESSLAHKDAWHIVFVEYGTPRVPADPGLSEAFRKNKSKVKRIQKRILEKGGIPID
jgi:HK97 gp10 family phage protein